MLETIYHNGDLTSEGYNHYLQMLLAKYGLVSREAAIQKSKTTKSIEHLPNDKDAINEASLCKEKVQQLEKEIDELKLRIHVIENDKTK